MYSYLQALRYDFRFEPLESAVRSLEGTLGEQDPFVRSLFVFSLLGQGRAEGLELLDDAIAAAAGNGKCLHAVLHGLWFADTLPGVPERMLEVDDILVTADEPDAVALFRRASALRLLHRYDEAIRSLDLGVRRLDPSAADIHQDFARERAIVQAERRMFDDVRRMSSELQQTFRADARSAAERQEKVLREQAAAAQKQVADALFKVVEILGLFSAVLALLVSTGASAAIGDLQWWQRLLIIANGALFSIGFFVVLRRVVRPVENRPVSSKYDESR